MLVWVQGTELTMSYTAVKTPIETSTPNALYTRPKNAPETQKISAYPTCLNQKMLNLESPNGICFLHDMYQMSYLE